MKMKTEIDDGRWEVARGGEGRGSAHNRKVALSTLMANVNAL